MAAHNGTGGRRIALCCVPHHCRPPCVFSSHQPPPAAELAAHNRGELDGVTSVARREHHDSCSPLLVISAHTTIDLPHMCCCALSHPCSDLHPISIHSKSHQKLHQNNAMHQFLGGPVFVSVTVIVFAFVLAVVFSFVFAFVFAFVFVFVIVNCVGSWWAG